MFKTMACCLSNAMPLSEPLMVHYHLDHRKLFQWKFLFEIQIFHSRKYIWKCHLQKDGQFVWASIILTGTQISLPHRINWRDGVWIKKRHTSNLARRNEKKKHHSKIKTPWTTWMEWMKTKLTTPWYNFKEKHWIFNNKWASCFDHGLIGTE